MKKIIAPIFILFIIVISFINIDITKSAVEKSLFIYFNNVFPYTFPFLFFVTIFIKLKGGYLLAFILQKITNKLLKIDGYELIVYLCSLFGGYPTSAIYSSLFYNEKLIGNNSANKMINFASFPSLFFIFGSLSFLIKNNTITIFFYASIIISSTLLIRSYCDNTTSFIKKEYLNNEFKKISIFYILFSIKESLESTIKSTLMIISSFVFCSVISNVISFYFPHPWNIIFSSIIEFSGSSIDILSTSLPTLIKYNIILFSTTFGGLSILVQMYTNSCFEFNIKRYIYSKIKHAFLACLIFNMFYIFLII